MDFPLSATSRAAMLASIETVKELHKTDFETYRLVKDKSTSQHYVHYSFFHIKLSEGGIREEYDYFLPLDENDVLSIVLGEQPYLYPDHWKTTYLRSGTDDRLVPFHLDVEDELQKDIEEEMAILEALQRYKQAFENAENKDALTKDLFSELDANRKKRNLES